MSVTRNIVKGVVKAIERTIELGSQVISVVFNGTDQYATHSTWTPAGANFTQSVRYTPYANAMGSAVTILGDHLTKNASDQLVYSYTDSAAGARTVTLTAVTLVADTESTINISSDGNGVTLAIGSDEATNSAVVDPSTLSFETWMRDSGGADYNNGVVRNVEFTDLSPIQDGDYLEVDSSSVYVEIDNISMDEGSVIDFHIRKTTAYTSNIVVFGGNFATNYYCNIQNNGEYISLWINNSEYRSILTLLGAAAFVANQTYHVRYVLTEVGIELYRDSKFIQSQTYVAAPPTSTFTMHIFRSVVNPAHFDGLCSWKLTKSNGDTYEYLLDNIVDNGDGTGTAPNTGSTGSSFDGAVSNFYPLSSYEPPATWVADTIGAQWTDNGDGSYTLNGDGSFSGLSSALDDSKKYDFVFTLSGLTGSGMSVQYYPDGNLTQDNFTSDGTYTIRIHRSDSVEFKRFSGIVSGTLSSLSIESLTDLTTVANNTRSYPVNVDSATQPDILNPGGGNDATIVNYRPDMAISSFNELGEEESAGSDWTDLTGGVWQLVTTGDADYLTFAVVPGVAYYVTYTIVSLVGTGTFSVLDDTAPIAGLTTAVTGVHITTHTFTNSVIRFARGGGSDVFTGVISNIQLVRV